MKYQCCAMDLHNMHTESCTYGYMISSGAVMSEFIFRHWERLPFWQPLLRSEVILQTETVYKEQGREEKAKRTNLSIT